MHSSKKGSTRFHVILWLTLLSLLANASTLAADDCEKATPDGGSRDCTFLEEVRECLDNVQASWEECMDDALSIDCFLLRWAARTGCEAAFFVNGVACGISVTTDWLV